MYRKEFDTLLATQLPQIIFLYGEGEFFIDFYIQEIKNKLQNHTIENFYFSDYNAGAVLDILGAGSLFGDASAVVLKLDSKLPKKDCESFLKALQENTSNHLVVGFYKSDNKSPSQYMQDAKSLALMLKNKGNDKNSVEVRFFTPNSTESMMMLRRKSKSLNLNADESALQFLLQMQNQNLSLAFNELDKYAVAGNGEITIDLIRGLSYGLGSIKFDDFLDVFFERNDFLIVYEKMREEGMESMEFLREMQRYFYILFLFYAYAKIHGKCDAKDILGYVPPQAIIEIYTRRALRFKEKDFQQIFEFFTKWHNGILGGKREIDTQILIQLKAIL